MMSKEVFIEKNGKRLRCGFTTGSCAAAASKAALLMLIEEKEIRTVSIRTPKGPVFYAEIEEIVRKEDCVRCTVTKDAGDDPDVTDGVRIRAEVCYTDGNEIVIKGGEGIGRVTKPGLDQPMGEHAINSIPRRMIRESLSEVLKEYGKEDRGVIVVISAEGGEEIAKKTFNPRLGIEGGISILGSTGIVEPMSDDALIETIRREIMVRHAEGKEILVIVPGNYGLTFLREQFGIKEDSIVLASNYAYEAVKKGAEEGFRKIVYVGHLGKLVKLAAGIRNTHSAFGDHRMEILSEAALTAGAGDWVRAKLAECVTTEQAVRILEEAGVWRDTAKELICRIRNTLTEWTEGRAEVGTVFFVNEGRIFEASDHTTEWFTDMRKVTL